MSSLSDFEKELLGKILDRLELTDVELDTVGSDTILFEEGLGLDSIDALEIGVLIEEDYGIVIMTSERTGSIFGTVGDLARFVEENRGRDNPVG